MGLLPFSCCCDSFPVTILDGRLPRTSKKWVSNLRFWKRMEIMGRRSREQFVRICEIVSTQRIPNHRGGVLVAFLASAGAAGGLYDREMIPHSPFLPKKESQVNQRFANGGFEASLLWCIEYLQAGVKKGVVSRRRQGEQGYKKPPLYFVRSPPTPISMSQTIRCVFHYGVQYFAFGHKRS
jgi:hypothetical protein